MTLEEKIIAKFSSKKIAILGWGVDTEDIAPTLLRSNCSVTIFDRKPEFPLSQQNYSQFSWQLGQEYFGDLSQYDLIIRNPSIRPDREEIKNARNQGVEVSSKTQLFFEFCPAKIIAVTGTKGKGTTATLISEMFRTAGRKIHLGGNIGTGIFHTLSGLSSEDYIILELSSFQLVDLNRSPHIAVVLMVTTEHQDWHTSPEEYVAAKEAITKFQTSKDFAIFNADYPNSQKIGTLSPGQKMSYSLKTPVSYGCFLRGGKIIYTQNKHETELLSTTKIALLGAHNIQNVMAAILVAKTVGLPPVSIYGTIRAFKGLEHRLEEVGTFAGVTFVNDSFSTVPETTMAAVTSFTQPLVLIAGGSEKNSNFSDLGKLLNQTSNLKAVLLIGLMAGRIESAIKAHGEPKFALISGLKNMEEIVRTCYNITSPGDVVVLSPGAASFDMFKNYKDRGHQFKEQVKSQAQNEHQN